MNINISIEWNKSHWVIWFNIVFSFGNGETHHNNKYMGTKKHQLNGVELTCTAIGIEIGRCRHLPSPILIFLHCNTPIYNISEIHLVLIGKNNSSIHWVEMSYPSQHTHKHYYPKHYIPHFLISHWFPSQHSDWNWNCPQANHIILNIIIIINPSVLLGNWNFRLVPYLFFNCLFDFIWIYPYWFPLKIYTSHTQTLLL